MYDFKPLPSQERILKCLRWKDWETPDPPIWMVKKRGTKGVGKPAGRVNGNGYRIICLDGEDYTEHRLKWKAFYGCDPEQLDHKDMNKLNNSISNLREVNSQQNNRNKKIFRNNTSGCKGVTRYGEKWKVVLCDEFGKNVYHGIFDDLEEACEVARAETSRINKVLGI